MTASCSASRQRREERQADDALRESLRDSQRHRRAHHAAPGGLLVQRGRIMDTGVDPGVCQRRPKGVASRHLDDIQVQGIASPAVTREAG